MAWKTRRKRVGRTLSLRLWSSSWLAIGYETSSRFTAQRAAVLKLEGLKRRKSKSIALCNLKSLPYFPRSFNTFGDLGITRKWCKRPEVTMLHTMDDRRALTREGVQVGILPKRTKTGSVRAKNSYRFLCTGRGWDHSVGERWSIISISWLVILVNLSILP